MGVSPRRDRRHVAGVVHRARSSTRSAWRGGLDRASSLRAPRRPRRRPRARRVRARRLRLRRSLGRRGVARRRVDERVCVCRRRGRERGGFGRQRVVCVGRQRVVCVGRRLFEQRWSGRRLRCVRHVRGHLRRPRERPAQLRCLRPGLRPSHALRPRRVRDPHVSGRRAAVPDGPHLLRGRLLPAVGDVLQRTGCRRPDLRPGGSGRVPDELRRVPLTGRAGA